MMLHTGRLVCDAVTGLGYFKSLRCAFYLWCVMLYMGKGGWFDEGQCGVLVTVNHGTLADFFISTQLLNYVTGNLRKSDTVKSGERPTIVSWYDRC